MSIKVSYEMKLVFQNSGILLLDPEGCNSVNEELRLKIQTYLIESIGLFEQAILTSYSSKEYKLAIRYRNTYGPMLLHEYIITFSDTRPFVLTIKMVDKGIRKARIHEAIDMLKGEL